MNKPNSDLDFNPESKYKLLHERGVRLKDSDIELMVTEISIGVQEAQEFLGRGNDDGLSFISSDNLDTIGYVPDQQVINIPIQYFKKLETLNTPLLERTEKIGVIKGQDLGEVNYLRYLRNAGREEAVHHYQYIGHHKLKAKHNEKYMELSRLHQLLTDIEVEARDIVDQIAISKNEQAIWMELDRVLQLLFPEFYNESIGSLSRI